MNYDLGKIAILILETLNLAGLQEVTKVFRLDLGTTGLLKLAPAASAREIIRELNRDNLLQEFLGYMETAYPAEFAQFGPYEGDPNAPVQPAVVTAPITIAPTTGVTILDLNGPLKELVALVTRLMSKTPVNDQGEMVLNPGRPVSQFEEEFLLKHFGAAGITAVTYHYPGQGNHELTLKVG